MASVLAVDDTALIRTTVVATRRTAGHEVTSAPDPLAALELTHAELVLADVNMPNMDSITWIHMLRAGTEGRFMPILMLTTDASLKCKRAGREAGDTGRIIKPFDPDRLIAPIDCVGGSAS